MKWKRYDCYQWEVFFENLPSSQNSGLHSDTIKDVDDYNFLQRTCYVHGRKKKTFRQSSTSIEIINRAFVSDPMVLLYP